MQTAPCNQGCVYTKLYRHRDKSQGQKGGFSRFPSRQTRLPPGPSLQPTSPPSSAPPREERPRTAAPAPTWLPAARRLRHSRERCGAARGPSLAAAAAGEPAPPPQRALRAPAAPGTAAADGRDGECRGALPEGRAGHFPPTLPGRCSDRAGWCSEHTGLVEDGSAHGRGLEEMASEVPSNPARSVILCFFPPPNSRYLAGPRGEPQQHLLVAPRHQLHPPPHGAAPGLRTVLPPPARPPRCLRRSAPAPRVASGSARSLRAGEEDPVGAAAERDAPEVAGRGQAARGAARAGRASRGGSGAGGDGGGEDERR